MQQDYGVKRNLWATRQSGLYAPKRMNFPIDSLKLYLPLGHPELSGSPIISKDLNAHSCTVTGAVHSPPIGRIFDGTDDYIDLGSSITKGLAAVTYLLWINPTDKSGLHELSGDYTNETNASLAFLLTDQAGTGTFQFRSNLWGEAAGKQTLESTGTTYAYGVWHLVGITWDGTTHTIYIDGSADGSNTHSDSQLETTVTENRAIGNYQPSGAGTNEYQGSVGEVWIYSQALTVREIKHIYFATRWRYV